MVFSRPSKKKTLFLRENILKPTIELGETCRRPPPLSQSECSFFLSAFSNNLGFRDLAIHELVAKKTTPPPPYTCGKGHVLRRTTLPFPNFLFDRSRGGGGGGKKKRNENGEFQIFHDRWRRRDKARERNMNLFPIPKNGQQISAPLHHLVFWGRGCPDFFVALGTF